jgi:uncharacterized protein (TIGR02594 family)
MNKNVGNLEVFITKDADASSCGFDKVKVRLTLLNRYSYEKESTDTIFPRHTVEFENIPLGHYDMEVSCKGYLIKKDYVHVKFPGPDTHWKRNFRKSRNRKYIKIERVAPWMKTAMNEIGQKEIPGPKNSPRVMEYHEAAGSYSKGDSGKGDAWCAGFVSWVMKQHGYTLPSYAMRALQWKNFGKSVTKPTFGAIGIKQRDGGGHVAFVVGKSLDGEYLYMLGGNQNDEVNISRYRRNIWEKFVVPSDYNAKYDTLPFNGKNAGAAGRED